MSASVWMDYKGVMVMVMSTNCQPSSHSTVHRKQRDGSSLRREHNTLQEVYARSGSRRSSAWVLHYHCRSRSRKFYKCVFTFSLMLLLRMLIPIKSSGRPCPFKDFKSFHLQLAKELIGEYCSRRQGRGGAVIHPPPLASFSHQVGQQW